MAEQQNEASVVVQLRQMLTLASSDPRAALGVGDRATAQDVRAAFLESTKRYHPTKFARLSPETIRLANDVFIALRGAHATLAKAVVAAPAPAPAVGSGPAVARASSQSPAVGRLGTPSAPLTAVSRTRTGTGAAPTTLRASSAPPVGTPRTGTPSPAPLVAPRTSTPSPAPLVAPRTGTPSPAPPLAQRPSAVAPRPPAGNVTLRPRDPVTGQVPAPRQPQPTQPPIFDEQASLRNAMELLGRRRWVDAKQAFLTLASKVPAERRYRALLSVARGREHQDENRHVEARVEFKRALELDPGLDAARAALEQLGDTEKKSGGLFGRLLKK